MPSRLSKALEILIKVFLAFLPFHVIISVLFQYRLGIPGVNFLKEGIILLVAAITTYLYFLTKKRPKLDILDYLIFAYVATLVVITLFSGQGISALIYGGRYDFEFLFVFLLIKHTLPFLKGDIHKYTSVFLISGGIMLVCSLWVKFVVTEAALVQFGFSEFGYNGLAPPTHHRIEGVGITRFQGILDGPNQMAFFLMIYMGVFLYEFLGKKGYEVFNTFVFLTLAALLVMTFSRSGYLGFLFAVPFTIFFLLYGKILNRGKSKGEALRIFIKKYKKRFLVFGTLIVAASLILPPVFFGDSAHDMIIRKGSTGEHLKRFTIGFKRFQDHPFGQGLASSGPASRSLQELELVQIENLEPFSPRIRSYVESQKQKDEEFVFSTESFYIPESWFLQQLIEGGIAALLLFSLIMLSLVVKLIQKSPIIAGVFVAVITMNGVLHTFETMYASLLLFSITAMILYSKNMETYILTE